MNNEELDAARAKEAWRIWNEENGVTDDGHAVIAARLARESWTPPKPVSDDLLAARAHAKASGWAATAVDAGSCDHTAEVVSFLAGCTRRQVQQS